MERETALVALDIEGDWNWPLLQNAAAMSSATLIHAVSDQPDGSSDPSASAFPIGQIIEQYDHIIACETTRGSSNIYRFPSPRGRIAVIVGNEERGIPRNILKKADSILSIPMIGAGMSSVNVAVAGAIALYALSKDLGRGSQPQLPLKQSNVDILIHAPDDPHELGSLFRSAWSFGWKRVFLSDPMGVWFTNDRDILLEGRAAARSFKNPLSILPSDQCNPTDYDLVLACDKNRVGTPLSRLRLSMRQRLLVVFGNEAHLRGTHAGIRTYVDHINSAETPRFRHAGSILMSLLSQWLER